MLTNCKGWKYVWNSNNRNLLDTHVQYIVLCHDCTHTVVIEHLSHTLHTFIIHSIIYTTHYYNTLLLLLLLLSSNHTVSNEQPVCEVLKCDFYHLRKLIKTTYLAFTFTI